MKETNQDDVLSRLMDGEWDELDATRCVAGVCESDELKAKWARYHMARDVMRGEVVDPTTSIAAGVAAALADEPAYTNVTTIGSASDTSESEAISAEAYSEASSASETKARSRWGMGAAGLGIAASAALATVLGMDFLQNQNNFAPNSQSLVAGVASPSISTPSSIQTLPVLVNSNASNGSPIELVSNRGSYWVSGQDGKRVGSEARLNQLLGDHIEHSATGDWRGMMPYSRLVGYDTFVPAEQ